MREIRDGNRVEIAERDARDACEMQKGVRRKCGKGVLQERVGLRAKSEENTASKVYSPTPPRHSERQRREESSNIPFALSFRPEPVLSDSRRKPESPLVMSS